MNAASRTAAALGSLAALALALPTVAQAQNLSFTDCSATARRNATLAVVWLQNSLHRLDAEMGENNLMDWPGNSRSKFRRKLRKRLRIRCISSRRRCEARGGFALQGRVVPVLHQRRIALCVNNFDKSSRGAELADFIMVIAHEVGHLVRFNSHRRKCSDRYYRPRFSQSVGLAAKHAALGTDYSASTYASKCPP
jgi:hypothetical protein